MQQWLIDQVSHPLHLIGSVLAICAGLAFLTFLWGVIDYMYSRENDDEQHEGNVLTVWSMMLMTSFFIIWEIVRWIAGLIAKG